jgi:hypothetical protein
MLEECHGRNGVLVSRFFAPKIATYYDPADPFKPINPDAIIPGWRKLVRLTARSNNVFDRGAVKKRSDSGMIKFFLTNQVKKELPGFIMPQGRVLRIEERDEILGLLKKVFP